MTKLQQLINQRQDEAQRSFMQDYNKVLYSGLNAVPEARQEWLDTLTAASVLAGYLLALEEAAHIVEEMMEDDEHWKPITQRILALTTPKD